MRHKQNTFLAGVAALALFAASGAFAQQGQTEQKGGAAAGGGMHSTQGAKSPGGMSQGGMNHGGMKQGGAAGQNAQSERQPGATGAGGMATGGKSPSASSNRSAQELNKNNKGAGTTNRTAQGQQRGQTNAQSRTTQSQNGRYAAQPENRNRRGGATAQRNESLKGLQGNTKVPMQGAQGARGAGTNVSLNDQQRTQIRDTIINARGAPRVGSVNFAVNVGTVVPRGHLHLVRVPETLVRIDSGWRGFLYFVYNDEVVIVDPHDMRIVEVLPV
ncbi:MAG: DUF1236 domain-containing protein [Xanthobacteraceae bacterium]